MRLFFSMEILFKETDLIAALPPLDPDEDRDFLDLPSSFEF